MRPGGFTSRRAVTKTIAVREKETDTDFHQVPDDMTLQQAFELLQKDTSVQEMSLK